MALLLLVGFSAGPAFAAPSVFTLTSVTNNDTMVLTNPEGETITITGTPNNQSCFSISNGGVVTIFSRASVAACDQSIIMTFTTSGFDLSNVNFPDIDDMDGTASRDAFAASVPGTWTPGAPGSDGLTLGVFNLDGTDETFSDAAGRQRLIDSGAVGTFLAREVGNNPLNDSALFTLTTPTNTFNIIQDDVEGARSARTLFTLNSITADIFINPTADDELDITGNVLGARDTIVDVITGDEDPDGTLDLTTLQIVGTASPGDSLTVTGQGVWSVDQSNGTITFTPEAGFRDDPTPIMYNIADDEGLVSNDATVSIDYAYVAAEDDDFTVSPVVGASGGTSGDAFANDTLNDVAVNPADVTATVTTPATPVSVGAPVPFLSVAGATEGNVIVPADTPSVTYTISYQLC
jgi:hypothetical protein